MPPIIFKNFSEYWSQVRQLSQKQRDILFSSFNKDQQNILINSFKNEGWDDLFFRNQIDKCLDDISKNHGIDMLKVRCNALKGKPFIIKKDLWNIFISQMKGIEERHKTYVLSGIKITPYNRETLIIEKS